MAKRLFVVAVSDELVIYAEDAAEAGREAYGVMRGGGSRPEVEDIQEMTHIPSDWAMDCIPYGASNAQTIGDLIEAGAAPKYTKMRDALMSAKGRAK